MKKQCPTVLTLLWFALAVACASPKNDVSPWFDDISAPAALTENAGCQLAAALRTGLKNQTPVEKLVSLAPDDKTPRALFITLSDGLFPARVYYAAGGTFREALRNLLTIIQRRESEYAAVIKAELEAQLELAREEKRQLPPYVSHKMRQPGQWSSLQLDVVQAVLPRKDFHIGSTRVLLTSAVGLAFDRGSSFAFPPEQLTGRYLMNGKRQLAVPQIANLISESTNWLAWRLWNEMCAADTAFNVTLFESDSYYADGSGVTALFRGRPLRFGASAQTPAEIAQSALPLARLIAGRLNDKGFFPVSFPEWVTPWPDGRISCADHARLIDAMLQTAAMPGLSQEQSRLFIAAARRSAQYLLKSLRHYDANEVGLGEFPAQRRAIAKREFATVVEPEILEDGGGGELPRRICALKTNAMVYLAFADLAETLPEAKDPLRTACSSKLKQLCAHILAQFTAQGEFVALRRYPELTPALDASPGGTEEAAILAVCGNVILRHLQLFPEVHNADRLRQLLAIMEKRLIGEFLAPGQALADYPLADEVARFLAQRTTNRPEITAALARLALAAQNRLILNPMLPDMFGAPEDIPSMTYAAQRLETAAIAVRAIAETGKRNEGTALLHDNWPLWVFMQQAAMIPSVASALPQPALYLGFMRDNLADFGFTLDGLLTQLHCRLALARTLSFLKITHYAAPPPLQAAFDNAWKRREKHPLCLAEELVVNSGEADPANARHLSGTLEGPTVKEQRINATLRMLEGENASAKTSSRILKKR